MLCGWCILWKKGHTAPRLQTTGWLYIYIMYIYNDHKKIQTLRRWFSEEFLLQNHEYLSPYPQNTHKKLSVAEHNCNPNSGGAEMEGFGACWTEAHLEKNFKLQVPWDIQSQGNKAGSKKSPKVFSTPHKEKPVLLIVHPGFIYSAYISGL